jgi:hypothetical protein
MAKIVSEVINTHVEELSCDLTAEEWETRASQLANTEAELEAHTSHELDVKATLKADRARLEAQRTKLAQQVRSHSEIRAVTVQALADFKAGIVSEVREDTGKLVRTRPISPEERQTSLDLHDQGGNAAV